jgi:dienelactone hydrolase
MKTASIAFTLGALASFTGSASAQDGTFIVRTGADTTAIERFHRTPGRVEGELAVPPANARQKYAVDLAPDGSVAKFTVRFWLMNDPESNPPRGTAVATFGGDSVSIVVSSGSQERTQKLATKAGAIPYINPSMLLLELAIARGGRQPTGVEVPVFMMQGGQTVATTVRPIGGDSILMTMGPTEMRFAVDKSGRIQGGGIPSQNLSITVAGANAGSIVAAKTDYSAPPGAPYTAENVTVPTPMGHKLAGTLTLPKGAGAGRRVPAIVTITGSGSEDRDEAIPIFKGYRPFRELADSLGRRGIAVLRMDDRGFAESGGDAATATSADFAEDIRAGLAYLRTRPEIDGARLGLVGHSEGGIIAPMVATKEPTLKGIVLLAGTSYTGRQILNFQLANGIKHDTTMSAAKRDSLLTAVPAQIDSMASRQPWLKFFLDYNPEATAKKVTTPVLILNGSTDQQVTPEQAPILEKAFKSAGNRDVTMKIFPNLNHLFVPDSNGFPGGYTSLPSMKVDPAVIGMVVDWLAKRLAAGPVP